MFSSNGKALTHIATDRSMSLNTIAKALLYRFNQSGKMEDLEDAISTHREALALRPLGHLHHTSSLNNLGVALVTRFDQLGMNEDLEHAISFHREALSLYPPVHPHRSISLNNFGTALHTRFKKSGRMEDLDDAISSHREALTLRPLGHPERPSSLNNLANALSTRFNQLGRMEDLDDAISFHRETLALRPLGHSDRPFSLNNLGISLSARFDQSAKLEDLGDAISFHREALALLPPGHTERSLFLNNLGVVLSVRFNQSGGMEDLEDVISLHREALTLRPLGHPDRPSSLNNLADVLCTRFKQSGGMEDLEDAISAHREALTLLPLGHIQRSSSLDNLAVALSTRFNQSGRIEDLEEAISSHREALALRPLGHSDRSLSFNNLGIALLARFDQLGRMEDLEDAISFHRDALSFRPPGHPDRSFSLNNLGIALSTRFHQSGRVEDLEDVISSHREALTLRPQGHSFRSSSLNNLADALHNRFNQSGVMEDLEDAVLFHREALTLHPVGHPHRSSSLNNLGIVLYTRVTKSGSMKDAEDAISSHREALTLRPSGHPERSSSLNNIANALSARFDQSGKMEDLEDAISSYREALTLRPFGHPDRSLSLTNLGAVLLTRFRRKGRMEDLEEVFTLYEQAATDSTSSSLRRLSAVMNWVDNARHYHHGSIISAYSISLCLLDRCLNLHPNVDLQHKFLASTRISQSLASDAASAAIDAGDLKVAVELLEQGRTILWSRMEKYRHPLDQLRHINRELADRLQTLSIELEHLSLSTSSGLLSSKGSAHLEAQIRRNRILSENLEEALRQVREMKGFENFLQAVPFATLQAAAAEGPVILVSISNYRSDAIILHIDSPPTLVTLPKARRKDLIHLVKQLALAKYTGAKSGGHSKNMPPILRAIWTNVISPVIDCLTELGVPEKSRVWWCPTSELCALPLHAAGPYCPRQKNLPDIYISSYIPTLSALIRARSNIFCQSVVPKLLVIGQPSSDLQNVQTEIDNIQQLGDFVDVIVGAEANCDTVLLNLQDHSWAHFACHGHLGDNSLPFHGSFELHNGGLTLLDLIQAKLPNAELAFLSACHSAEGDLITPDETIHLAAALQFCGFRSVVGTLWSMADEDGPIVSKEFYKHMFRKPDNKADFRDSAEALNSAIRALRKNRVPLERWILFVHIGA